MADKWSEWPFSRLGLHNLPQQNKSKFTKNQNWAWTYILVRSFLGPPLHWSNSDIHIIDDNVLASSDNEIAVALKDKFDAAEAGTSYRSIPSAQVAHAVAVYRSPGTSCYCCDVVVTGRSVICWACAWSLQVPRPNSEGNADEVVMVSSSQCSCRIWGGWSYKRSAIPLGTLEIWGRTLACVQLVYVYILSCTATTHWNLKRRIQFHGSTWSVCRSFWLPMGALSNYSVETCKVQIQPLRLSFTIDLTHGL